MLRGGAIESPLHLPQDAHSFDELRWLRTVTDEIDHIATMSLNEYRDEPSAGYFHLQGPDVVPDRKNEQNDYSKGSSATVIPFLLRTGGWRDTYGSKAEEQAQVLLNLVVLDEGWTSADLPEDNPFTVGFALQLVRALRELGAKLDDNQARICGQKLRSLVDGLTRLEHPGRAWIQDAEPNSYLTYLSVRALLDLPDLDTDARRPFEGIADSVFEAAKASLDHELALLATGTGGDAFELGYALLLVNLSAGPAGRKPETRLLLRQALAVFFDAQLATGNWPRSKWLFRYKKYGNAYCFEFEFLTSLLSELNSTDILQPYFANFHRSVTWLAQNATRLPGGGFGWPSGHHPQFTYPESWSTASAFHFCHLLNRLVADAVTAAILRDLGQARLVARAPSSKAFDEDLLDSPIARRGEALAFVKELVRTRMLNPILDELKDVEQGKRFSEAVALSAIVYGPPGTSKTTLGRAISAAIGWDLLRIDPSTLLRGGQDGIHAELERLFGELRYAERVVVFFDEIDELVRSRFITTDTTESRLLTTSMLTRIADLRESRRVVFLVATNRFDLFDQAFARAGRFDLVFPMMPPLTDEKLRRHAPLVQTLDRLRLRDNAIVRRQIDELTYLEFDSIADVLAAASDEAAFRALLKRNYDRCILRHKPDGKKTWRQLVDAESRWIRLGRDPSQAS